MRRLHVGVYLPDDAGADRVFVLADPRARRLDYRVVPLPFAQAAVDPSTTSTRGVLRSADGVFVGSVGRLTGPLVVSVLDGAGTTLDAGPLAAQAPAGVRMPALAQPQQLAGGHMGASGQSSRQQGGGWPTESVDDDLPHSDRLTARVLCYGGGRLGLRIVGHPRELFACDGVAHTGVTRRVGRDQHMSVRTTTDRLVVLQWQLVEG